MNDASPPVPPDSKDWTWVLERPCPDCGFVAADFDVAATGAEVLATAARLAELLADDRATTRPTPDRWSATEYACHVRDVYRLYDLRLHLMLDEDDPLFANWDQDDTAIAERYDQQEPATVAGELADAAEQLAASFATVQGCTGDAVFSQVYTSAGVRATCCVEWPRF